MWPRSARNPSETSIAARGDAAQPLAQLDARLGLIQAPRRGARSPGCASAERGAAQLARHPDVVAGLAPAR